MPVISISSLSGGQGKTTVAIQLGLELAAAGKRVLWLDCDPQSNLSTYSGCEFEADDPTLLEVIKGDVALRDATYPTLNPAIDIVPSDDSFEQAQTYLQGKGSPGTVLKRLLKGVDYDWVVIDSPPQRSLLAVAVVGAADYLLLPVSADSKGVGSLARTLAMVDELVEEDIFTGQLLGAIPFRDKWVGRSQTRKSSEAIGFMREIMNERSGQILPSVLESDQYVKAVDRCITLSEVGFPELKLPLAKVLEELKVTEVAAV